MQKGVKSENEMRRYVKNKDASRRLRRKPSEENIFTSKSNLKGL